MKRYLVWLLPLVFLAVVLCISFIKYNAGQLQIKDQPEKEDGILQVQEQEFNMTKDPALGYVPKFRLYQAINDAMIARHNSSNSVNQVQLLSWIERGSYKDTVGGSNGNGRPGSPVPVTSGRMRAIWMDLDDGTNKTAWLGGVDGSLWKTTDVTASPANWTLVSDFFGNLSIASICQDPTNHSIMYFGTGEKTFNADAVEGGGVWKSTDHGVTWSLLANTTGFWNVSKVLCDASGNVYVGTIGSGNGLERSNNGGTSWTNITPTTAGGGTRIADMVLSTTGRLHVSKGYESSAANQTGYFYTDNPSTVTSGTWTSPVTSYSPTQYNCALAVKGDTLYALPDQSTDQTPTVYRTTDGGANWSATAGTLPTSGNNAVSSGQGWYCLAIGVDPNSANNVIVGGLNCYKTTNGGTSWSQISAWVSGLAVSVYIHADQHFVQWNGNQVLVGSDGGIFYSSNGGTNFSDRNVNLRLKQFYSCAIHPSSTNYFLAGAQDNGVQQFNGAGLTNSVEVNGGDGALVAIDQNQPLYQFSAYVYSHYHRSTDGGNTWSDFDFTNGPPGSSDIGSFINPFDYDDSANVFYAAGNAGQFLQWTNSQTLAAGSYHAGGGGFPSGVSLITITTFNSKNVTTVKVSPYTSNRVYFGTDSGMVIKVNGANTITSGSAGTNITGASFPTNATVSCINVGTNDNNLIVTYSNYGVAHVWITSDGGSNWTNVSGNLPDIPVRWAIFYPNDNSKGIIATEMGIYETTAFNGGSTVWAQNSTFPIVRTDMLKYRSSDKTLLAATHGRGLWTTTINTPLPVTLLNFSGQINANTIQLNWNTSSEQNSSYFEIQKSNDGSNFFPVGQVNAAGNSNFTRNYSFTDRQISEINYYRLKMVDVDDKFVYSKTILIKDPGLQQNLWVLNNIIQSYVNLRFAKQPQGKINIVLINAEGIKLYHHEFPSSSEFTVDLSGIYLSTGVYFLKAEVDGKSFVRKLVKN